MKYTHCHNCGEKLSKLGDLDYECFFWCDEQCKSEQQTTQLNNRKKMNEMHSPAVRRGEVDIWPELVKVIIHQAKTEKSTDSELDQAKTGRKCGKCGQRGHNARTCKE